MVWFPKLCKISCGKNSMDFNFYKFQTTCENSDKIISAFQMNLFTARHPGREMTRQREERHFLNHHTIRRPNKPSRQ